MKITRQLTISIPPPVAWKFLHDVSAVTACLPGMEYRGQSNEGHHLGRIAMKVGPFQATFEGEGHVTYDDQQYSMHIDGKGVDRKGGSRSKISMICRLSDAGANRTSLEIDADVQLSGAIAQF